MGEGARTVWLALSVVLTSATQLRPGELPLGAGETLLALWLLDSLLRSMRSGTDEFVRDGFAVRAGLFWTLSACLLGAGALLSMGSNLTVETGALHDAAALAFSAAVSILVALQLQARGLLRAFLAVLVATIAVAGFLLLLAAFTVRQIGPVNLWYAGIRFAGWATNPNQLALLVVGCPFLAWQLAADATSRRARVIWLGAGGVSAVVGIATLSDALTVAWGFCLALAAMYVWRQALRPQQMLSWRILLWGVLLPLTVMAVLIPALGLMVERLGETAASIYGEGNQGSARLSIWMYGIDALIQSPVFGWGPGAHAGKTAAHQGFEAHNTYVDWATATGFFGLAAYVILLAMVVARAIAARRVPLVLGALSLVVFSTFHYVLRHPMFWIYLVVIYEYSRACIRQLDTAGGVSPCAA